MTRRLPRVDRYLAAVLAIVLVGVCALTAVVLLLLGGTTTPGPAADAVPVPAEPAAPPPPPTPGATAPATPDPYRPDTRWLATTAQATGIPTRALSAYARAHLQVAAEVPGCQVAWNTLAALGGIESAHGSAGGAVLGEDGWARPAIRGPALDGNGFAAIRDTDAGALDGDRRWDRAVGPLQFIPETWSRWAADANGDGVADPNQIDDAALAAGHYLCHSGDLTHPETWRRAVFSFNHSEAYVVDIAHLATTYAARASRTG